MSRYVLKIIALICMLCDHTSKVCLSGGVLIPVLGAEGNLWLTTMLEVVGRMALPIFVWFTAEGAKKTRSPRKYLLRLLLFAVLSEMPFQLCFYGAGYLGFQPGCHNVIFTMFLGASGILAGEYLKEKLPPGLGRLLPALAAVVLGWVLHTDYNAWGVGLIIVLYYLQEERGKLLFLLAWCTVFQLIWHGYHGETLVWLTGQNSYKLILQWMGMLLSVGLLATYNGEKGKDGKWLFYVFYPLHLLILYFIRISL